MKKLIIGLTGSISSGKGTVVEHLEKKYGASGYTFSTMLKDALKRFHLEINRDNLIKMSEIIRETFGEDTMAKTMGKDVESDAHEIIVVDGVRRMADIEYLKKIDGFVLVKLEAKSETRYKRMITRGEKADDNSKTYDEFLADAKRSTEVSIDEVKQYAQESLDNNGSFEELYAQVDTLVAKYAN